MHANRRQVLVLAGASLLATRASASETYPSRPITFVVPWAPGGGIDIAARNVAQKLESVLGKPVIVDNKSGAAGLIGTRFVVKAPADGYTLLIGSLGPNLLTPAVKDVGFDPLADLRPIGMITTQPMVLLVGAKSSFRQFPDVVNASQTTRMGYASAGIGSVSHYIGEVLNSSSGAKLTHVPYRGSGPAFIALQSDEIQVCYALASDSINAVKAGQAKALLVTSVEPSPLLPNVPSLKQYGLREPAVENWNGLFAPAGTPQSIVDKLSSALTTVLNDPSFKEKYAGLASVRPGPSAEFAAFLKQSFERTRDIVKTTTFKAEE